MKIEHIQANRDQCQKNHDAAMAEGKRRKDEHQKMIEERDRKMGLGPGPKK